MDRRKQVTELRKGLNALAADTGKPKVARKEADAVLKVLEDITRDVLHESGIETKPLRPRSSSQLSPHQS